MKRHRLRLSLDILVQSQCNPKAATFLHKAFEGLALFATVMIADKLASYGAARKQMRLSIEHRQHKRIEQSGREFIPLP